MAGFPFKVGDKVRRPAWVRHVTITGIGRDYFLGDLVTVSPDSVNRFTRKIFGVQLSADSTGREDVKIELANP